MNVTTATVLQGMQERLSSDYLSFFMALRDSYEVGSPVRREAELALQKIQYSLRLIGRASGAGGTAVTQNELDRLQNEIVALNKIKSGLSNRASRDREIAARLYQVQRDTGVSKADLSLSSKMIREAAASRQSGQQSGGSLGWAATSAALGTIGHGAVRLMSPMLGPFSGPLAGMAALATPFLPLIGRGIKSGFGALHKFGRLGAQDWEDPRRYAGQGIPMGTPSMGMGDSGMGSGIDTASILSSLHLQFGRSLFEFYDKRAFDARYTKALLRAVKGQAGDSDDSKGPGFLGMLGGLFGGSLLAKGLFAGIAGILGFSALDTLFEEFFPDAHAKFHEKVSALFESFKESLKETVSSLTSGSVEIAGSVFEGLIDGFGSMWSNTFKFMEDAIPGWENVFGTFSKDITDFFSKDDIWKETSDSIRYILENFKVLDEHFTEKFPILNKLKWAYLPYTVSRAVGAVQDGVAARRANEQLSQSTEQIEIIHSNLVNESKFQPVPGLNSLGPDPDLQIQNVAEQQEITNSLLEQMLAAMITVGENVKNGASQKIPFDPSITQAQGVTFDVWQKNNNQNAHSFVFNGGF